MSHLAVIVAARDFNALGPIFPVVLVSRPSVYSNLHWGQGVVS
jgi:hypothetical protein